MRKCILFFIAVILSLISVIAVNAEEESITITTYYPSPYGSYNQLQTNFLGVGDNNGDTNLDENDAPPINGTKGSAWIAGNVGIGTGTTGPASLFFTGANDKILDINSTTKPALVLHSGFTDWSIGVMDTTGNLNFVQEDTGERMVIDNAGSVGIGTTVPNTALDLNGAFSIRGMSDPALSPAGQGRIYFNSTDNRFKMSENGGGYTDLGGGPWAISGNNIYNTNTGNVGIGTTNPTAKLEVECPSGFTNIKAANNQIGCMQTDEAGSYGWEAAENSCFNTYGGRLATTGEWYIAMANFVLNAEGDNWEWNDDAVTTTANTHAMSGAGLISTQSSDGDSIIHDFRCWLPR